MGFVDGLKRSLGLEEERTDQEIHSDFTEELFANEPDFVITPEQPFYEVILMKVKTMDDMQYVFDQIVEEKNPVIIDLSYLEQEGTDSLKLAGEKLKILREEYKSEAILLHKDDNKNLIIITPDKVKLIRKD
ncbi:MAG: cell division protein SepF [Methanobacteriaceae archaeon]